jgi:D-galactarolactone isomerase
MHIYEPGYPMRGDAAHPSQPATLNHYLEVKKKLGLTRTVIVQPGGYGTDNTCTLEAMAKLGKDNARGVATVDPEAPDSEIERLTKLGMRGIRYHMRGGVVLGWDTMARMAARVAPFGWHVQLQCEPDEIGAHVALLSRLPCDLVIDHMGRFDAATPESDRNLRTMMDLLVDGRCWVKLSGPYYGSKSGAPRYEDKARLARALIKAAPERMVWATNWPHPSMKKNYPDEAKLLDTIADWTDGNEALRTKILVTNPAKLYGFACAVPLLPEGEAGMR